MQRRRLSLQDPQRVHTTGSFTVGQLNSRQKSFVAFGNVPKAVMGIVRIDAAKLPVE
jgi:hypothetical protein